MTADDLSEVSAIEAHSFRAPWPDQIFVEELDREWAHLDVIRERDEAGHSRVIAFTNYWLVRDEVHLLNIAVHPDRRRNGFARLLMEHLLGFARSNECRYITLEARRSNVGAIALYRAYGFDAVGVRPKYYAEDGEDAIVMTLEL